MGANSRFSWNEITAIATGVQALVVIVGSALALWQLRLALTARQMGGFLRLIDELEQGTVQETRRFFSAHQGDVRRIAQSGSIETLDKFIRRNTRKSKQQLSMSTVRDDFTRLEYAAMLCLNGMLPLKLERTYFTTVVALTWPDIQSTVLLLRKTRGNQYLQHFEALYLLYTSGAVYRRNYTRLRKREAQRLLLASRSIVEVSKNPRPGRSG
jgi:hypothetical protein